MKPAHIKRVMQLDMYDSCSQEMITCPLCAASAASVSMLLTHIRLVHACDPCFHMQCGLQGCQRTFRNFYTYRNHVYSMHGLDSDNSTNNTMELEATGESVGLYDIYTGDIEPMVIDGSNHTERDQVSNEATLQEDSLSISSITGITCTQCIMM